MTVTVSTLYVSEMLGRLVLRLRALLFGLFLLGSLIASADYSLRHGTETLPAALQTAEQLHGWEPSPTIYLKPPSGKSFQIHQESGQTVELSYDERGFRRLRDGQTVIRPDFVCLGDFRVLAPDTPADQTFLAHWQKLEPQPAVSADNSPGAEHGLNVINSGLPDGCPLLYWLHSERFASVRNAHWLCVIGQQTAHNDFQVRRTMTFDASGFPLTGTHRLIMSAKPKQPKQSTNKQFLMNSPLFQLAIPHLSQLLLGEEPAVAVQITQRNVLSGQRAGAGSVSQLLDACRYLKQDVTLEGGKLTLIYLPTLDELNDLAIEQSSQPAQLGRDLRSQTVPFRLQCQQFADRHQLSLVDLTAELLSHSQQTSTPTGEYFLDDKAALSPTGHRAVGQNLQRRFSAQTARHDSDSTPRPLRIESQNSLIR